MRPTILVGVLLAVAPAGAHERTASYSSWEIRGREVRVTVRLSELDASRVAPPAARDPLGAYLAERLRLLAGGTACPLCGEPRPLVAAPGRVAYEWRARCRTAEPLEIRSDLLLDVAPTHLHFVRVSRDGAPAAERVLADGERGWRLDARPTGTSFAGYFVLGVGHVLAGWDHLVFLLALLLVGGSLAEVARVVTGFTLAHSLTLALSVLAWARPEAARIEALIGLSIALVAVENVWLRSTRSGVIPGVVTVLLALAAAGATAGAGRVPAPTLAGLALFAPCYFGVLARVSRPATLRWAIAAVFGLVHGFGFAAVVNEAHVGALGVARALGGFNLGVEVGQLLAIAAVFPVLALVHRREERWGGPALEAGSAAVLGLGLYWFVSRAYG